MTPVINYCFDTLSDPDLGYPNLAQLGLAPDEFDITWPKTLPCRLFSYYPSIGLRHRNWLVDQCPPGSWYPIALAWHDFDCDYMDLLKENTKQRIRSGDIKLLFYYHEGDNPYRIKERFDGLCDQHQFTRNCYLFLSANTAADHIKNFSFFPDHELFFHYVNRHQGLNPIPQGARPYQFTAVNRSHKWWRATIMTDLKISGLLDHSLWSYNTQCDVGDLPEDNPIIIDDLPGVRESLGDFISQGPYWCDSKDSDQHNDHRQVNTDLFTQSHCHLVIETHFDADQSQASFMTEKTYKCLKFGQPFVIIGTQHSIRTLRDQGYRVYDSVIDHSYDEINDNTERWKAVKRTIEKISQCDLVEFSARCREDALFNQQKFLNGNGEILESLARKLHQLHTRTP